jgi:hypothetical protein
MTTEAESMPLADYLVSKGVDPAKASVLGAQGDSISRNRGMGELERAFTQPAAPPPAVRIQPATPDQATAALREHEQSVQSAHLDAHFAPPPDASYYQFPHSIAPETDDAIKADGELRAALHAEGFPRHVVEGIGEELARAARTRMEESPEQAQERQASVRATLERWYGRDTDANLRLVDGVIDRLIAKGGATADFVAAMAPHLDALSIDSLVQFAKHRAGRR